MFLKRQEFPQSFNRRTSPLSIRKKSGPGAIGDEWLRGDADRLGTGSGSDRELRQNVESVPWIGTFALTALVHEGADGRAQLDYFHMGLLHGPPKGRCPDVQEENSEASR